MADGRVHVVGAGLAGLAAAVALAGAGRRVTLYEAGRHAGGRCRSYFDAELGCRLDNGNHLLLSGNRAAMSYLAAIGSLSTLNGPAEPEFDFIDVADGRRWRLRPSLGRVPWWVFDSASRVPGTKAADYLAAIGLARAAPDDVVTDRLDSGALLYRRLWEPLAVAALNTAPEEGTARLLWRVVRESFGRGGRACRPLVPREGLSETFVDPAISFLRGAGSEFCPGTRLRAIEFAGGRVAALDVDGARIAVDEGESVVLAVTAPVAERLVPDLVVPTEFRAIVNAHYRFEAPAGAPPFVGVIGGTAEWVFRKPGVLSVTVSAADRLADRPADELAPLLWRDVVRAYELPEPALPPWRVVKEKRATFAATPAQEARRPGAATRWCNLALAGDWTATGLPATIEGAIRSGRTAASVVLRSAAVGRRTKGLSRRPEERMVAPGLRNHG